MADQKQTNAEPTNAELMRALIESNRELAKALKPQGQLEQAGLSEARIARIKELPQPQRYRKIPWRSDTGATAIATVVEGDPKKFPHGRVTELEAYTHPPEAYVHESEGGHVPDGQPIWANGRQAPHLREGEEPDPQVLDPLYRQSRWERYYQADLRTWMGKALQPQHCQHADGLKTPWIVGAVGARD